MNLPFTIVDNFGHEIANRPTHERAVTFRDSCNENGPNPPYRIVHNYPLPVEEIYTVSVRYIDEVPYRTFQLRGQEPFKMSAITY